MSRDLFQNSQIASETDQNDCREIIDEMCIYRE